MNYEKLDVALIPSIPVQESEAESQVLSGAATVESPAAPYAVPKTTGPDDEDTQSLAGAGSSDQVPTGPKIETGAGDEKHEHYWIHTVTETIDRGNADFEAYNIPLTVGLGPVRIFGLDDLRNRADIIVTAASEGASVYFGKRDRITSDNPQTGFLLTTGAEYAFRSRQEAFIVVVGSDATATVQVCEYKSEPTDSTLGKQAKG